nr:MAG TPA: hypothetical protein [Caudoviricetes sp.]
MFLNRAYPDNFLEPTLKESSRLFFYTYWRYKEACGSEASLALIL